MLRREPSHVLRVTARWAVLSTALGALLFFRGQHDRGSRPSHVPAHVFGLAAGDDACGARPDLVEERFDPVKAQLDAGGRLASGLLFLVTLTAAALDVGRLHASVTVPRVIRTASLVTFALATLTQA